MTQIFNLNICDENESCDVTIWDLDSDNGECSNVKIWPGSDGCDIGVYIPGPVGPIGPVGPQGPTGPSGSIGGLYSTPTESISIPVGQYYTFANPTAPVTLTLPSIAAALAVLLAGYTTSYTVANLTAFEVEVIPDGSDEILAGSPVFEPFKNTSFTFVPTTLGWVIV